MEDISVTLARMKRMNEYIKRSKEYQEWERIQEEKERHEERIHIIMRSVSYTLLFMAFILLIIQILHQFILN